MTSLRSRLPDRPPAREGDRPARTLRVGSFETTWAAVLLLLVGSFLLTQWATRPAPDREAGRRALTTADRLQDLGVRVVGNAALARGLDLVAGELAGVPGLQIERQHASGTYRFHTRDVDYTVDNVIARQVGDTPEALLVNVHVDSAFEGPGAADDGVAVGALIEAARQLAGREHHRTIIYLFNGGEEVGLTGADAFTRHPWAKDVRWFLNLEAVGSAGLPILFQAGDNGGRLVDVAGDTPRPYGSILGQWLFGAGLINSDTDSRVWRGHGWSGLDYAVFEDGYAYHTPLDRVERIGPGTAQAFVDLTTGVAGDVADATGDGTTARTPHYVDVQSRWWLTFDPTVTKVWTLALLLALAALVWRAGRTWGTGTRRVVASAGAALIGIVTAVLAGVVVGVVAWAVGGSFAWYAHPWLVYVMFLPLTVLGALAPQLLLHRRWARREPDRQDAPLTALLGNTTAVVVLGAVTAWLEIGPGYLYWVGGVLLTVAVGVALLLPRRWRPVPVVLSASLLCLFIAEFGRGLLSLGIPMMGRLPVAIPMDPVVAVAVAFIAVPIAFVFAPFVLYAGRLRRYTVATAVLTVCGLVVAGFVSPYSAERPKLVSVIHQQTDGGPARIELEGRDFQTPQRLGLLDRVAKRTGLRIDDDGLAAPDVTVPAGAVDFTAGTATGPLVVKIGPGDASLIRITVTGAVSGVNGRPFEGGEAVVDVVGRVDGYTATIQRTGPVRVEVDQVFLTAGDIGGKVLSALPDWTVGHGRTIVQRTYTEPGS
ncbi:M28 family peptidase [Dactylosporangium sp. NPDC005572]|uniref:M28 family peptidase n=1 Tax=Dactylosporangium sp. NPDC005572 TaxID=3156889 RepID=UPI0033A16518